MTTASMVGPSDEVAATAADLCLSGLRRDCGAFRVLVVAPARSFACVALPAVPSLIVFALLLMRIESDSAGRAYAAYGGV